MRSAGNIHKVLGTLTNNIYIIEGGDGLVIVDTGMPADFRIIVDRVKSLGRSPKEIKHILLTHFHVDHAGSTRALKELSGAQVYAHEADVPYLEGTDTMPSVYKAGVQGGFIMLFPQTAERVSKVPEVKVDVPVEDGDILPLMGGVKVFHGPGHTPGSVCYLWLERGVLFTGDVIQNLYLFLTLPERGFCYDFERVGPSAASVVDALEEEDVWLLCTGHGPVVDKLAKEKLLGFRRRLIKSGKA